MDNMFEKFPYLKLAKEMADAMQEINEICDRFKHSVGNPYVELPEPEYSRVKALSARANELAAQINLLFR